MERRRTALVLSGGGARGAYEVGILRYIREELPSALGFQPRIDIVCGTSVGAINACFIAATIHEPESQGRMLGDIWQQLVLDKMYELGIRDLLVIPWRLLRRKPLVIGRVHVKKLPRTLGGFLNTVPMERLVITKIPWKNIGKNFHAGNIHALSVSSTDISSGDTVVFFQTAEKTFPQWARDYYVIPCKTTIGPAHALASAAIPLLFPSVRVGKSYYCDGSLRQNTPLSPALRLGADRVIVVGLRHVPPEQLNRVGFTSALKVPTRHIAYSNPLFLLGKVFNALLLDRTDYDLDRLRLFNSLIEGGEKAYGEDFLRRINSFIVPIRGAPYRKVKELYIRPSEDIGAIAARYARKGRTAMRLRSIVTWLLKSLALPGRPSGEGDLLSYLLFDGEYAGELIKLGMADASANKENLKEFFSE